MPDRTIVFGGDAAEARYQIRDTDPATSGDFVIERLDSNGDVVDTLFGWDDTAEEGFGLALSEAGADRAETGAIATEVTLPK